MGVAVGRILLKKFMQPQFRVCVYNWVRRTSHAGCPAGALWTQPSLCYATA